MAGNDLFLIVDEEAGTKPAPLKISGDQLVKSFAATPINLRGSRVYQVAVESKALSSPGSSLHRGASWGTIATANGSECAHIWPGLIFFLQCAERATHKEAPAVTPGLAQRPSGAWGARGSTAAGCQHKWRSTRS